MTGDRLARFSKAGVVREEGRKDQNLSGCACNCISAGASGTSTAVVRGVLS